MKSILLLLSFVVCVSTKAQVQLSLALERNLYVIYEPLIVYVTLTNLSGRDLKLATEGHPQWFSFDIQAGDGRLVMARNFKAPPIMLSAGATVVHAVNITPRFPLDHFGTYRISAVVYLADMNRYFRSSENQFEITEGRLIRQEEVEVPNSTDVRLVSFLLHQLPQSMALYLRIEDKAKGIIYCTHQLGNSLAYASPETEIDNKHSVHVLQSYAPRKFVYTVVGLDGKVLERKFYLETRTRPYLDRNEDGKIMVSGGRSVDSNLD